MFQIRKTAMNTEYSLNILGFVSCLLALLSLQKSFAEKNRTHSIIYFTKSALETVSNPMYCCINDIFRKLRHDSAMNIILRPSLSSW